MSEDLMFSRIVLGFWRMDEWNLSTEELIKFLEECMDIGITTMDHADIYGNYTFEELFGKALELRPDLRKRMEIVTKCTIVYPSATVRVKYYDRYEYFKGIYKPYKIEDYHVIIKDGELHRHKVE